MGGGESKIVPCHGKSHCIQLCLEGERSQIHRHKSCNASSCQRTGSPIVPEGDHNPFKAKGHSALGLHESCNTRRHWLLLLTDVFWHCWLLKKHWLVTQDSASLFLLMIPTHADKRTQVLVTEVYCLATHMVPSGYNEATAIPAFPDQSPVYDQKYFPTTYTRLPVH